MSPASLWLFLPLLSWAAPDEAVAESEESVEEEPTTPDRSGPPEVLPPDVLALPEPERHVLSDAVEVLHVPVSGVRKVEITIVPRRGRAELDLGRHVESAMGWLADVATEEHEPAELEALEDLREIDVYSNVRTHDAMFGVEAPREELALGLELLDDMVHGATFPKADLKRYILDQERYYLLRAPSRPRDVAGALLAYAWFPADHPYGERPDLSQYDGLKNKQLAAAYHDLLGTSPITVLSVGDIAYEDVQPALEAMLKGVGTPGEPAMEIPCPPPASSRVLASALPGQEQVTLRLRTTAPSRSDGDHVAAWAGSYVLGGHFLSRLNANLREDKGWTYGSRASYDRGPHEGTLTVSVDVKAEDVAGAVGEIEKELQRLVDDGVTASELVLAQRRLVADWNETLVTAEDAHGSYLAAMSRGQTMAQRRADYQALSEVEPTDVQRVAEAHWGAEGVRVWVLVGDRGAIQAQLDELGWTAEWVDPADAILGKVPAATP